MIVHLRAFHASTGPNYLNYLTALALDVPIYCLIIQAGHFWYFSKQMGHFWYYPFQNCPGTFNSFQNCPGYFFSPDACRFDQPKTIYNMLEWEVHFEMVSESQYQTI